MCSSDLDVVTGTLRIHTLFARVLIDPGSTHSFVSVSFAGLLGLLVASMDFDLIVASPVGDSVVASRMLRNCIVLKDCPISLPSHRHSSSTMNDTGFRVDRVCSSLVYPQESPFTFNILGTILLHVDCGDDASSQLLLQQWIVEK